MNCSVCCFGRILYVAKLSIRQWTPTGTLF